MARKLDKYAKAAIVLAVRGGTVNRRDACKRYLRTEHEFSLWERAFDEEGITGLTDRRLNLRRRMPVTPESLQSTAPWAGRSAMFR
jgi:hypothetical protein